MEIVEKNALHNDKNKKSLASIFGRKQEFKNNLLRLGYEWNIAGFPEEITKLLEKFSDSGRIYLLIDEKLRVSLTTYVNTVVHILSTESNRDMLLDSIKTTAKEFESTLIPYLSEFSKNYKCGSSLFHIIIKHMISLLLKDEIQDQSKPVIAKTETHLTNLTNSLLRFARKRAHISLNEKTTNFIEDTLLKIPVSQAFLENTGSNKLEELLSSKGFSINLFNQVYIMLSKELKQTMEKNMLQSLLSLKIRSKTELFENITMPLSRRASEEILDTLKQQVKNSISKLEEKSLGLKNEIDKVFQGFDNSSKILWTSINSEIAAIKQGKDGGTIDEVKERSAILNSLISKKMWALSGLLGRKVKLDTTINNLRVLEEVSIEELMKHSSKIENASEISSLSNFFFAFLKHFGKTIDRIPQKILQETEQILKSSEKTEKKEVLSEFVERHFITKKYHTDRFLLRFLKCFEDIILPIYLENSIMKFFVIWPPIVIDEKSVKIAKLEREALYVGDFLIPENRFLELGKIQSLSEQTVLEQDTSLTTRIVDKFSKVVTVLVYDIRGSTFMGMKLGNAKRESEIRREFGKRMLKIAEKYGAFPVKDTGDGGILFFSNNSRELYGRIYSPARIGNEWIRTKYKQEELELKQGIDCAKMAILAAKEMLLEAQKFVSENMNEFSDWFKEEKGRTLFFKGITYAQLPPSYKKIFQIGIGIASGHPGKDINFSTNAYGDPDVTGNLIRDANLYSKARNPESSVILIDSSSMLNLLLNEENIEPVREQKHLRGYSGKQIYTFLFDKTLKQAGSRMKKISYQIKKYGLLIERIGQRILEKEKEERIIPSVALDKFGLNITDAGQFKDIKGGIIKFLYEVTVEE